VCSAKMSASRAAIRSLRLHPNWAPRTNSVRWLVSSTATITLPAFPIHFRPPLGAEFHRFLKVLAVFHRAKSLLPAIPRFALIGLRDSCLQLLDALLQIGQLLLDHLRAHASDSAIPALTSQRSTSGRCYCRCSSGDFIVCSNAALKDHFTD